jgi:hypothetical protein
VHLIFLKKVHALESLNDSGKKACITQLILRIA